MPHRHSNGGSTPIPRLTHIVVTGAAGAIGGALAQVFARRFSGAHLSLVDVDKEGLSRVAGSLPSASTCAWDLSDPASLPSAWEVLVAERGSVDGLINCAGIMNVQSLAGTPWSTAQRLL